MKWEDIMNDMYLEGDDVCLLKYIILKMTRKTEEKHEKRQP
jgi:hypothetical protein